MTRVLHILDHSLPLHSGYTFRTRAILRTQIAQGLEVRGLTGQRHSASGPAVETIDGITFFRTTAPRRGGLPLVRELREVADLEHALEGVIRSWRPDIIHAHSPVLNALSAQRVARRHGIPMLYEIRAFWEDAAVSNGTATEGGLQYRLTRWLETRAVKRADAVAVICEGLKGDLVARGIDPAKTIVSPNGVDMEMFGDPVSPDAALRTTLGLEDAEVIGFIGSFYDYEGLDDLIAAMPMLVAARPKAKLLLVGGGPMEVALRAQADGSSAREAIRFVGRVPHDEVENYYALTDILAYPRKAQRLTELVTPLKPLEAMAQGRLVAASSVGGHRELIEDGVTGTLFEPDNPASIADALGRLLTDRAGWEARRATARAFVERERNWAVNVSRYQPVYHILVEKAGKRLRAG
ncbi:glycosyltransferase, exosortase A system-associated [Sphingobium sp. DEHP117]|uniref:TIGR04063 family PEP-CTERM/XrtA system glycosyltransferase n=1 Tax=Sphingobium sp. DEHP117 TaxID=2993436 RepID=UPI0027D487CF|nr:TIGR04063 family PEP-CTERM/XrtA system glycosyltransferase [Sphingobium sp. DEHP117]MDQ4418900.1 glycosyltransferase, exosortase A system-associated [Sphingobium sp. DEHP117]